VRTVDLAIVGGGPAGLATAIFAARRGLHAVLIEQQRGTPDKACGEGLMPAGVRALEALDARRHIDPAHASRFVGIRYVQEDGSTIEGRFHDGEGLGVRRTALMNALTMAARDCGVELHHSVKARDFQLSADSVQLAVGDEQIRARLLVAADGLHSPIRRQLGLDGAAPEHARFGLRRHYAGGEPDDHVEVHWSNGVECYLTPVGPDRLGVAFLFEGHGHLPDHNALLTRFPRVVERLANARVDSTVRGAGPLAQRPRAVMHGRVALVGDAAGYVDAITGEGLSLSFASAQALVDAAPDALADPSKLARYAKAHATLFDAYARPTRLLVWLSRQPALRRRVFAGLSHAPKLFELALEAVG